MAMNTNIPSLPRRHLLAAVAAGRAIPVMVDVNMGMDRTGIAMDQAGDLFATDFGL